MIINAKLVKELRDITGVGMMDCKKALVESAGDIELAQKWLREKGIAKAQKKQSRIAAEGLCEVKCFENNAILFELNSETDFVSKNAEYLKLKEDLSNLFIERKPKNTEEALQYPLDGKTVADVIADTTFKIGEKISLRRVVTIEKENSEVFGLYKHNEGRIAVLTVLKGEDAKVAKDIAMHIAAINPKYMSAKHVPDSLITKEKEILKAEALNEGKPENIVEKMVLGRLNKYLKEICLVNQPFVKDSDQTVEKYLKSNNMTIKSFTRLEVGEGIEKKEVDFAGEVQEQINK